MKALEKLDNKSTYKLIKYRDLLVGLQLEELQPVIDKCRRLITNRCEALGSKLLVGRCFSFRQKNCECYAKFTSYNEKDGSIIGEVSNPLRGTELKRIGQKNRKYWVCNYSTKLACYQIYGVHGACDLVEVSPAEYEKMSSITKWKRKF